MWEFPIGCSGPWPRAGHHHIGMVFSPIRVHTFTSSAGKASLGTSGDPEPDHLPVSLFQSPLAALAMHSELLPYLRLARQHAVLLNLSIILFSLGGLAVLQTAAVALAVGVLVGGCFNSWFKFPCSCAKG